MANATRPNLRESLFRVSVSLKGVHAVLEILGGVGLLIVTPDLILRLIALLTQDELAEDPRDLVANYVLHLAKHLSTGSERFAAFYLLAHGVIKLALVMSLLKDKLWAYPVAVCVFGAFIVYQIYRFTFTHSIGLIALSVFDLAVICLMWLEYRALKRQASMTRGLPLRR